MKRVGLMSASIFGLFALNQAHSTAAPPVQEIDSVDGTSGGTVLHSFTPDSGVQIHLASYHCVGGPPCQADGGEGLLVRGGTGCTSTNTDGGSSFYDGAGNCWYRKNLKGDLRQWGVTANSAYDANANPTSASDATPRINAAYSALASAGITDLSTHQVSIYVDNPNLSTGGTNPVQIPTASSLSCGAVGGGQFTGGVYTGHPGTIYLRHKAYLNLGLNGTNNTDSSAIHNCMILPQWLHQPAQAVSDCGGVSFGSGTTGVLGTYADLEALRANMIVCSDVAVSYDTNSGGRPEHLWIYGFDNPLSLRKSDHLVGDDIMLDGNVCVYTESGGGLTKLSTPDCEPVLTKQVYSLGGTGAPIYNSNWYQIQTIAPSPATNNWYGRPVCRVTLVKGDNITGRSAPDLNVIPQTNTTYLRSAAPANKPGADGDPINYPLWIQNLTPDTGALSCMGRGPAAVKYISKTTSGPVITSITLDLLETDFGTGMPFTATWDTCRTAPCPIRIVSGNVDALEAGESVSGTNIPSGATISAFSRGAAGPDPYDGYIAQVYIDKPLVTADNTGSDASITIDSNPNGVSGGWQASGLCNDSQKGQCAIFHAAERAFSGTSTAGATVSQVPDSNAHFYGAGVMNNGTAALNLVEAFSYGHHYGFVDQDANNMSLVDKNGDDNGELDDLGQEFFIVSGSSNHLSAQGDGSSKAFVGIVNDLYEMDDDTASLHTTISGSTTAALGVSITVAATLTGASGWPTDQGVGTLYGKGSAVICQNAGDPDDPSCGANHGEYVTYEITGDHTMTLTSRGRHFTAPQSYTDGATIIYSQVTRPQGCDTFTSTGLTTTTTGTNAFENRGGCLQLTNIRYPEDERGAIVTHNATNTSIDGSEFGGTTFYYEDSTAYASMRGCGNSMAVLQQWECHAPVQASASAAASVTLDRSAEFWPCDASSGPVTLTVPDASGQQLDTYDVKKVDTTANACTIAMSGSETLDGNTSYQLTAFNQDLHFTHVPGAASWYSAPLPAPIAHGQVYFSYKDAATAQLCPSGGSGLIVDSTLVSIPSACLYLKNTSTSAASTANYVFVSLRKANAVTGTASDSGQVKITTGNTHYSTGDQVLASCHGIGGTTEANVTVPAAIDDNFTTSQHFTLLGTTYANAFTGGGTCDLLGLASSTIATGHLTASNGVEVRNGTPSQTLVGLVYTDGSQNFNDSAAKRDVASWFNRRTKTCINSWSADASMTGTSYAELQASSAPLHCEFVAWANNDAPWSLFGMVNDNTINEVATIAAGFDGTTPAAEIAQWRENNNGQRYPLGLSGAAALADGQHYITVLGKAGSAAAVVTDYASGGEEVRLAQ